MNGELTRYEDFGEVSDEQMEIILRQLFRNNPQRYDKFLADKEADFAYLSKGGNPYRVNAFLKTGKLGAVLRKIDLEPRNLEDIMFQTQLQSIKDNILQAKKGLFLVTGPTGAGKSTTIVAMLEEINRSQPYHIISIEDPIEYIFKPKKSLISQRELGHDTWSFSNAIKSALREDPDVIFVGEIRNVETAEAVLDLAETGHLVFSTLHTNSAPSSINRFLSFFPSDMQLGILDRLGDALSGILSQTLVKKKDGLGRIAVFELLLNNTAVRNNLKKRTLDQIPNIIETSSQTGMVSTKQYARKLQERDLISQEEVDQLINSRFL
ncbi:PilT/PilU family type 4a pilus ATPase [bacterium]|nr:PilT/PilU family type 4a pilus ATPase [bacterium]